MRLVYFGTPAAAVPPLEALLCSRHEVVAVVTRPDRPRDRAGGRPEPSPVKRVAVAAARQVLAPPNGRDPALAAALRELAAELGVACAYGHLLGREVLDAFPSGVVNLHFSLLPAYRGAAPVQRALLDGRTVTGVTTFRLDEGMDTGPVLLREEVPIRPGDDQGSLTDRLSRVGAEVLVRTVDELQAGSLTPRAQPAAGASLAPRVAKKEARLDFTEPAAAVVNRVRAFSPAPGAWATFRGGRLGVLRARAGPGVKRRTGPPSAETPPMGGPPEDGTPPGDGAPPPGTVYPTPDGGLAVVAGEGVVVLERVRPQGRRPMSAADFARGARLSPGERLGD